jgi:hypothetical protein
LTEKSYYSVRTGKHPTGGRLDLQGAKDLFLSAFRQLESAGLFQQALGFRCVDAGDIPGSVGADVEAFFFRTLKKRRLWPIPEQVIHYTEEDLFDIIEVLHDCASKGVDGRYHSWDDCGWHYDTFDQPAGLEYLRPEAKTVLLSSDEGDLFALANNFGVRHHNLRQKTDYDKPIWLSWMFYYYLATIHAVTRLIDRRGTPHPDKPQQPPSGARKST